MDLRVEGAIDPLVPTDIFDATRRRLKERQELTNVDLLNYLTALWCKAGYLSIPKVNRDRVCPTAPTYRDHFGRITDAYKLIGYKQVHVYRYSKIDGKMRHVHRKFLCWLITAIKRDTIVFDEKKQVLLVSGCFAIAVVVLPYLNPQKNPQPGWKLYFDRLVDCNAIFIVRMDHTNTDSLDFYLMPRNIFEKPSFRFTDERIKQFRRYKLRSVSRFEQAVNRMRTRTQSSNAAATPR